MSVDTNVLAQELVSGFTKRHGVQSAVDGPSVQSKLSELMNKLIAMGFDWSFVMSLVSLLLPMIMTGKFDFDALWAFVQSLIVPKPTPNPVGPVTA